MNTHRLAGQTLSRAHIGIPLCLVLLVLLAPLVSRAQTHNEMQGSNAVIDFKPAELRPMPSPDAIARARQAYFRGDIVRIIGGSAEDMKRLLGVNFATSNSTGASADSGSVLAIRKANGVMRQYHAPIGSRAAAWRKAFEAWKDSQTAPIPGAGDPTPPAEAWTLIQQNVYSGGGGIGGNTNYTVSIFRLNTTQTQNDYYMVVQDSNAVPNYYGCYPLLIGTCGFWTDHRTFSMSAGSNSMLTDHGPTGTITTESAGFNIGGSLSPQGPGGSVGFSETWSQPSVTTTDHSDNATAAWREDFTGRSGASLPPGTSTGSFLSHQGAIFQVPFGQSFTLTLANSARFVFLSLGNENEEGSPDDNTLQVNIPVNPPILSMSPPSLTIAPGQARVASVTATIPGSYQGLSWQLTLQPAQGLAISQTTGSDSANLLLTVEPGQPIGTTWNLNLQTAPPYGAPVVAKNPIIVTVTAGSPPPLPLQGILLAGGVSGGAPSSSAEVYDTLNNSIVPIAALNTARSQHTATALANGKILIAGGQVSSPTGFSATATAELYDPNTQTFTALQGARSCPGVPGCMSQARWGHSATLLPDGRVLIAGGADALESGTTNTAELYDPATQTFTLTGPMATQRIFHTAAWIPSEKKVLISGGYLVPFPDQALDTSEYFDPATGQFSPGPMLPVALASPASVSTGPCVFCLIGGMDFAADPINNFSIFSAQTAGWASAGTLNTPRSQFAAIPLGTSGLLVTGGSTRDTAGHDHVSATAEVNSLSSNAWQGWKFANNASTCPGAAGCMAVARANHTASVLPDGRILLAGGQDDAGNSLATTEIYDPQSQTFTLGPAMTLSRFSHSATPFHATNVVTKTTLDSSQNPSVYGQPVNFTATVTSASAASPDGSVTFNDGSTLLGKVQLTGGSASFKAPSLSAGNHSIQAVYSGSDTFAGSTSPAINQVVSMLTPSISAASSPNPSTSGDPVTFIAHVTSSDGTPQGTVDFLDGTTLLKTIPLQDSEASYSTNALAPGSHAITAKYSGDGNYRSVTSSPPVNQIVVVKTQTAVTSSANPSVSGQIVNFTATVTATGSTPVGTVDFIVDSKIVASGVSVRQGQALYSTGQLSEGNHTVTAAYRPDPASNFSGSTSPTITQSVLNKTTTALTSSVNPSNPGQSVTFRASVTATAGSPTGTVDFLDGLAVIASKVPLTSGSAAYSTAALPAGSHSVTAVYRPDANTSFSGSTSNPLLQVILSTTSTLVNSSLNPSSYGQSVMFTATVTSASGTPTGGTVTFTDSGVSRGQAPLRNGRAVFSTAALAKGAHAIVASYSGNGAFGASKSPTLTQTVSVTTPLVRLSSSQNPSNQGQLVTFTAAVTGPAGTSPTGAVVFLDGGSRTLGTAPLSGTIANYSTSALSLGTHSVTAAYQGDDNFGPATSQPVSQMVQGSVTCLPATVLLSASPSPSMLGQTVMFDATVNWSDGGTPVGNVTLSETLANGQVKIWGTADLQAGAAVFQVPGLPLGTHRMYVTYGGDAPSNHCGATSASLNQQVRNRAGRFRRTQSAIPRTGAGHGLPMGAGSDPMPFVDL
jgi:Bacterial Ig-like domain (group 3)/Galactose oxidase, central domain/Kelch motif